MKKQKTFFGESALWNNRTYAAYLQRISEISMTMFEYENLPDTVDERFLELTLLSDGLAVYFRDEVEGDLALQCMAGGRMNHYRIPIDRTAYAVNGYQRQLTDKDSVIIWNNYLHTNTYGDIVLYARRLWDLDRIIDINAKAQRTPVLIHTSMDQRLTLMNLYKEYEGNAPVIFGDKNLDLNDFKALSTAAPYVADRIYQLKTDLWNECLMFLGVPNVNTNKRERMNTMEVSKNLGGTVASRYSRLLSRQQACEQINRMFGTNISVHMRDEILDPDSEMLQMPESSGDEDE